MRAKSISIVIPVFNERKTIVEIFIRVKKSNTLGLNKEIIIVDDGSTDGTTNILKQVGGKNAKIIYLKKNRGKGFALRTGFKRATGDIILVQDSDLEYHPKDYPKLIRPFIDDGETVVYGSRELLGKNKHSSIFFHAGGRLVTLVTNILYGSATTGEATMKAKR
ncbi:MAG: Glycosyltransferase, group 2 family [Candidatus Woesebacteria bacterium GW2011_GWA1_39_11b]|nr:MAG: Glycosyltransferase, group 2 family [Candidatus Woesebacteria bacterium GW2011_GWA1_39_11b]